jgi:hypothetical protein
MNIEETKAGLTAKIQTCYKEQRTTYVKVAKDMQKIGINISAATVANIIKGANTTKNKKGVAIRSVSLERLFQIFEALGAKTGLNIEYPIDRVKGDRIAEIPAHIRPIFEQKVADLMQVTGDVSNDNVRIFRTNYINKHVDFVFKGKNKHAAYFKEAKLELPLY